MKIYKSICKCMSTAALFVQRAGVELSVLLWDNG